MAAAAWRRLRCRGGGGSRGGAQGTVYTLNRSIICYQNGQCLQILELH